VVATGNAIVDAPRRLAKGARGPDRPVPLARGARGLIRLPGTSGERTEVAVTPEPSYADRVAALTFEGVEWTREKILENEQAVWLTEEALVAMLHDVGFASIDRESRVPAGERYLVVRPAAGLPRPARRLVAASGVPLQAISGPLTRRRATPAPPCGSRSAACFVHKHGHG
jgi:hypothetical protein